MAPPPPLVDDIFFGVDRDDDDFDVGVLGTQTLCHLYAAGAGHEHVEEDEVARHAFDEFLKEDVGGGSIDGNLVLCTLERAAKAQAYQFVVV